MNVFVGLVDPNHLSGAIERSQESIRRMETIAIFPGMYEWTEMRGPRSSEEVILRQVVLEDHLQ